MNTDTLPAPSSNFASLKNVLADPGHDPGTNLLQLQGWRGEKLQEPARTAAWAQKLAPAACGILSLIAALAGSMALVVATLSTAVVGVVARNHPFESVHNAIAWSVGLGVLGTVLLFGVDRSTCPYPISNDA